MSRPLEAPSLGPPARKPLRRWTLARVAEATGASWRLPARVTATEVGAKPALGAGLDSRAIQPGEVFVPLPGNRVDGHQFVSEARAHGAVASFCRSERVATLDGEVSGPLLVVEDPERALQTWGAARRAAWPGTAIGVTGTAGKTTTKDLLALCMATLGPTLATAGNRNNHLGVPLTLTGLSDDHAWAVLEMGMNHRGEIARLAEWARPQAGVITHVGPAHLEALGSIEEVARAKAELAAALPAEGLLVVPGDEPHLERALEEAGVRARRVTFAVDEPADYRATQVTERGPAGVSFAVEGFPPLRLKLAGRHNVKNALAALACARELGASPEAIAGALASAVTPAGRMEIAVRAGVTLLLDHYNANPDSARAALETLRRWPARRRFVALGEMRELGDFEVEGHRQVGEAAAFADGLFCIGEATAETVEGALAAGLPGERAQRFQTREELARALAQAVSRGDAVLVKGSRAARMEEVAEMLMRLLAAQAAGES